MIEKLPNGNSGLDEYLPFADVDFIVTDLDGTLTVGVVPVLEQIKNKIVYLKRAGVFTTVATGRTYVGARELIEDLNIRAGMPIALYNGGVLIEHNSDNLIAICSIPYYAVEEILNIVGKKNSGIYIYTFDMAVQNFADLLKPDHIRETVYYTGRRCVKFDVNGTKVKELEMARIRNQNVVSILLQKNELAQKTYNQLMLFLETDIPVTFTDSGNGFVEIKGVLHDKSSIIRELKRQRKTKKYKTNKILAIGDNDNDLDLLKAADISVAVANASSRAIEYADYVCENANANGFLDMLTVIERAKYYFR